VASRAKAGARREKLITALLLIAGALLALALFAAGALWRGKSSAPRQKTSILTPVEAEYLSLKRRVGETSYGATESIAIARHAR